VEYGLGGFRVVVPGRGGGVERRGGSDQTTATTASSALMTLMRICECEKFYICQRFDSVKL
jgi:hypothetical protein